VKFWGRILKNGEKIWGQTFPENPRTLSLRGQAENGRNGDGEITLR